MIRSMTRTRPLLCLIALIPCALCGTATFAHPTQFEGDAFRAGLLHPFTGLDHFLAMLAVGLWAAQLGRTARWIVPTAFISAMLIGGAIASVASPLPLVEVSVAGSVLVLGLLIAFAARVPLVAAAAVVGLFAIFHGYAHVTEAPSGSLAGYAGGFVTGTLALHLLGLAIGLALSRMQQPRVIRACGAAVAFAGLWCCLMVLG